MNSKYVYWQKCPYDHDNWIEHKKAEIVADVYEQYLLAQQVGVDILDEVTKFDQAGWCWVAFDADQAWQRNPNPEDIFFDTYDDRDPYEKFETNLTRAYNDFHEEVDRAVLASQHAQERLIH